MGISRLSQKEWVIFGLFLLLSLVFTNPLPAHLTNALRDSVDPVLNTWILAWDQHALLTQPAHVLDANIFFPYAGALLYSETLIVPSILLLPVALAGANPVSIHNLMVLLGFTLTGFAGYLLGKELLRNRAAGLAAGLVLAFNPYTLSVMPKAQLLQLYWLPLALVYVCKLLRRPRPIYGLAVAGYLAAQFYTVIYYGIFAFLVAALGGGAGWLLNRRRNIRSLGLLAAALALGALLSLPLGRAYLHLSQRQELVRTLADAWPFSASVDMWRTPAPGNIVYRWLPAPELPRVGVYSVEALFPGLILLLLAALGLLGWLRHSSRRWPAALALGIAAFLLLSLGPYLQVHSLQPDFQRTLPYALLHSAIPGFTALRAPVRFASLVFLGLGLLAGWAIGKLRPRWQIVAIGLLFVEALSVPASPLHAVDDPGRSPVYAWLASQPQDAVLELPAYLPQLDKHSDRWLAAQYASISHWHPTPAGYSGFIPPRHIDLLLLLNDFPRQEALELLKALDVRHVIIHSDQFEAVKAKEIAAALDRLGLKVEKFASDWVVTLPASGAKSISPTARYVIPKTVQAGEDATISAIYTADGPAVMPPNSPMGSLAAEWREAPSGQMGNGGGVTRSDQIWFQPPFYVDRTGVATVQIPTPVRPGVYQLTLRPSQGGDSVSEQVTVVMDGAASEILPVPVRLLAAEAGCGETGPILNLAMQTIGWYDQPFSLSAHIQDADGNQVAQSDLEYPPWRPRANLLEESDYYLPIETPLPAGQYTVELSAYQWQQAAERTVPRYFLSQTGEPLATLNFGVDMPPCPAPTP